MIYETIIFLFLSIFIYQQIIIKPFEYYEIISVIEENGIYYGIMKNSDKTCKYKLQELNDFNTKLLIETIGIDKYSKKYTTLKNNQRYILTSNGDYCSGNIDI